MPHTASCRSCSRAAGSSKSWAIAPGSRSLTKTWLNELVVALYVSAYQKSFGVPGYEKLGSCMPVVEAKNSTRPLLLNRGSPVQPKHSPSDAKLVKACRPEGAAVV